MCLFQQVDSMLELSKNLEMLNEQLTRGLESRDDNPLVTNSALHEAKRVALLIVDQMGIRGHSSNKFRRRDYF